LHLTFIRATNSNNIDKEFVMGASSFSIGDLANNLNSIKQKANVEQVDISKVPIKTNRNKFRKIAFDMFESKFDNTIWELQGDGEEKYLVKRTDLSDDDSLEAEAETPDVVAGSDNGWSVVTKHDSPAVLHFMAVPIRRFSKEKFGYNSKTVEVFADSVIQTIRKNKNVAKEMVLNMDSSIKAELRKRCENNLLQDETRLVYSWIQEGEPNK